MNQHSSFLEGVRVLDFTHAFAGPLCTMLLAELGAEVVKVENPARPDETRTWPPLLAGKVSGYFSTLNRSKRSITLDLKRQEGVAVAHRLARYADVVVENYRHGVAEDLHVDYDTLSAINPGVVYCSISGFGMTGPYRNRRGYDPVLQAMGGLMGVTGEAGRGPVKSMIPLADYSTGVFAATAILAALYRRAVDGRGELLDMSMLDVMVALTSTVGTAYLNTGVVPPRAGTRNPARVPSSAFECSDGGWLQLVPNQRQWPDFCAALGAPELADDARYVDNDARIRNQDSLYETLERIFVTRSSDQWLDAMLGAGVAAGPIHTLDSLFADPQVVAREIVRDVVHPDAGTIKAIRFPITGRSTSAQITAHPPAVGEHTVDVLRDVAGLDDAAIDDLIRTGVVSRAAERAVYE